MNSKVKSLKVLCCVLLSIIMCMMSACFDLGGHKNGADESDFDNYYKDILDCFSNVSLYNQTLHKETYNYKKSFFNKECVEELRSWTSNDDCIPYDAYTFITFKVNKKVDICSLSMYLKGKDIVDSVKVGVYLFKVTSFKDDGNYATYDIWKALKEHEGDDSSSDSSDDSSGSSDSSSDSSSESSSSADFSSYDSLNINEALGYKQMTLSNSWDSFTFNFYEKEKGSGDSSNKPLTVNKYDVFVLMIKNNMAIGYEDNMTKVSFCATGLLVSLPSED